MKWMVIVFTLFTSFTATAECRRCNRLETLLYAGPITAASEFLERFKFSKDPVDAQMEANLIMRIMAKYRTQDNDGMLAEMWYGVYLDGRTYMNNALNTEVSESDRRALKVIYKNIRQTWNHGNG